jgi:hypothetical protein
MERGKALSLVGASRLGKTEWARSLGAASYMCGLFNLDEWGEEDTIIFDDIDFKFLFNWKCFFGNQKWFNATDKYRKKRKLKGKLLIWLCNDGNDPTRTLSGTELEWYYCNVVTIYLTQKLYE